ncbi:MAG: RagB/SusD family nutrient uptake outer membrane protein [Adhaeribacter sp.]
MKSIKYFFVLVVLACAPILQSCSIDEELLDTPTPELMKNEKDVEALIRGAYSRFNDASGFKFQGMMMLMLMADDLYSSAGSEYGAYGNRTLSGGNVGSFWSVFYSSIATSNELISTLDRLELSDKFEKQAYGEAHFLRAFSYYYLVRMYGGVPLRLDAVNIDSDFYLPRNTVDEVYAQIFSDLKQASKMLPLYKQVGVADLGRASKGAAQGLLAQAYLTYGNQLSLKGQDPNPHYTLASTYADSVINSNQYKLIPNFADLFDQGKEAAAYDEVLFGIRFQVDQQNRAQPAAGSEFAVRFLVANTRGTTGANNTGGGGQIRVMPWFGDYYRTGDYIDTLKKTTGADSLVVLDYRNEVSFYAQGVDANGKVTEMYPDVNGTTRVNSPLVGKYIDPNGKDERNHGNDLFVIRFAEMYLIKAEAENELNGPTPVALDAFNKVRQRARAADGTPRVTPADLTLSQNLSKSQFRLKIFDERGLEMVGEGQRWFDLVRMQHPDNPAKTMYEYQFLDRLRKAPFTTVLPEFRTAQGVWSTKWAVYEPTLNVSVPKFLLFPLPTSEILNNPEIGVQNQNPGW